MGSRLGPLSSAVGLLSLPQKKRIHSFLKRCRSSARHSQISLDAYLLLPVQRVPRYRMLLESLLACTPLDDRAVVLQPHPVISTALELVSGVATYMNEKKRESEGKQQLLYWQERIGNKFRSPLVQPHRTLIRDGGFTLLRVVKRSSSYIETAAFQSGIDGRLGTPRLVEVHTLHNETNEQSLIALLCSDIIVFLRDANELNLVDGTSAPGSSELFTVLRLTRTSDDGLPPASVYGNDNILRIACDSRAILYVSCANRDSAVDWMRAINLQSSLNT